MNHPTQILRTYLETIEIGQPHTCGALTLVPLLGGARAPDYDLAADALSMGTLEVEEIGGGTVPDIAAVNHSDRPVLLIDGEHLEGAKQNRIVNVSVLLAAHAKTTLPVSCVEQGRWAADHDLHHSFRSSKDHSYARLRRVQAEAAMAASMRGAKRRADQGQVWADISAKHAEAAAHSPTGAMRDAYEAKRGELAAVKRTFAGPLPGQTGVLAIVERRPVALDAFDKPETLARMWDRLVSGYALDSIGFVAPDGDIGANVAKGFIAQVDAAAKKETEGIGLGADVGIFSPTVVGNALVWESAVVHLALFAREIEGGPRIARPSARRRMRSHFHTDR